MYHITILSVGRLKEKYLKEGTEEYLKRLSAYARVNVVEVPEEAFAENITEAEQERVKQKEAERLERHIQPRTYTVALDLNGKELSSQEMSALLEKLALEGRGDVTFIIGGSLGLHQTVLERSNMRLSFSRMTFPHQLMRLILLEQVFRWFKIARGEPYHK